MIVDQLPIKLTSEISVVCRGIGRALLTGAIDEAYRVGLWNISLTVRTFNTPEIRLYENLGFVRVGTLRSVVKLPDGYADEYIYQRAAEPHSS